MGKVHIHVHKTKDAGEVEQLVQVVREMKSKITSIPEFRTTWNATDASKYGAKLIEVQRSLWEASRLVEVLKDKLT